SNIKPIHFMNISSLDSLSENLSVYILDTIEKARLELNENPDILHQDIQQVRDMIITRPDIGFLRTDDAFILRFLRARKFHQTEAFRLLAQYFQYRQLNLDMFKNFKADDPGIKRALTDGFPGDCHVFCFQHHKF
uniref:CRAL/TRIO N-terminal domain-containing protein n=1 Tax=Nothoprocta perdicaria TaxID=30464 RepID=A0A8C6ZVX0_NOTPE